jgi:hypothetical protein
VSILKHEVKMSLLKRFPSPVRIHPTNSGGRGTPISQDEDSEQRMSVMH